MVPYVEGFKHHEKFFVMCVAVEFNCFEHVRMECNWMNILLFYYNQKYSYENIFQSTSFHNNLSVGHPVSKDKNRDKCFLEDVKYFAA